jgi:hypothetical protein
MQAIHHLYITNQSTKNTAEQAERWRSASSTRTGRTHKEEGTGSRAEQEVAKARARKVSGCVKKKFNRPPRKGRTNNRRLKDGRRHVGYLRATKDKTAERKRIASKSPEKQQKGLYQYTAWKGLRLSNFSLYEGFFGPRKKDI